MKQKITLVLGALVSVGCLYWVFKDVDFSEFGRALSSIRIMPLLGSLALFYWSMYLRGVRWGLLFRPRHELPGRRLFRPIMICFAFNSILPGRVGEVVRALYVGKKEETGFANAMATVVTERIFDGITLLGCLAFSLALLPPIDPTVEVSIGQYMVKGAMLGPLVNKVIIGCAVLVAAVVFLMIPGVDRLLIRVIRRIPGVTQDLGDRIGGLIQNVIGGFDSIRNLGNFLKIVGYSIAIWLMVVLSNLVLAFGMDGVNSMNFLQAMAILTMIAVFIMIPAAPGYWGLFEAGTVFALKVLGVEDDRSRATSYAVMMHLVQYVPIVVIGLIFAAQSHVKVAPRSVSPDTDPNMAPVSAPSTKAEE